MGEVSPRERMRRALSCVAQARLAGDAQQEHAAETLLEGTRKVLIQDAEQLGKKLRILFAHQNALNDNVMSGKIKPKEANQQNRKLAAQIAELRAQITELNTVIAAQTAEDLGGSVPPLWKRLIPLRGGMGGVSAEHVDVEAATPPLPPLKGGIDRSLKGGTPQSQRPKPFAALRAISLRPTKAGFILWLICFVAVIVGSLIYLRALPTLHPLQMSAAVLPDGNVRVRVKNDTGHPIRLNVPRNVNAKSEGYGIEVSGKESAEAPFSPTPTTGSWQYGSGVKQELITTEIGPGFVEEFVLRIDTLTENGHKPTAVKIDIISARGRTIAAATVSL